MAFYDNRSLTVSTCPKCIQLRGRFNFFATEFNPGPTPPQLVEYKLSLVEEQLIAAVSVTQFIYFRRGGQQMATKGHCISFHQSVASLARQLPRSGMECPILIVRKKTGTFNNEVSHDLRVRRAHVEYWLRYCKARHPSVIYRNIEISQERLNLLPEDGGIDLPEAEGDDELMDELRSHRLNDYDKPCEGLSNSSDSEQDGSVVSADEETPEDEEIQTSDLHPASSSGIQMPADQTEDENTQTLTTLNNLFSIQSSGKFN